METMLERFKNNEIAVNAQTEQEAKEVVKYIHEQGIRWYSEQGFEVTHFEDCKSETCYYVYTTPFNDKFSYDTIEFNKNTGREIVSAQEFLEEKMKEEEEYSLYRIQIGKQDEDLFEISLEFFRQIKGKGDLTGIDIYNYYNKRYEGFNVQIEKIQKIEIEKIEI